MPFQKALVVYVTTRVDLGRLHRCSPSLPPLQCLALVHTAADGVFFQFSRGSTVVQESASDCWAAKCGGAGQQRV
eukprot:3113569-Rhodomonas_salina.1